MDGLDYQMGPKVEFPHGGHYPPKKNPENPLLFRKIFMHMALRFFFFNIIALPKENFLLMQSSSKSV